MSNINGSKKEFLAASGLELGTIAWREYLDGLGFTGNSIAEDTKAMLIDGGYWVGNINQSLYGLYLSGGAVSRYFIDLDPVLFSYYQLNTPMARTSGFQVPSLFIRSPNAWRFCYYIIALNSRIVFC